MQISDQTFVCDSCEVELALEQQCDHVCDSCEVELALEQQCDHDPKTVHHWCIDCCSNSEACTGSKEWDDLD